MYAIEPGVPHLLGAVIDEHGVNFSLFSQHATSVELLLFSNYNDTQPVQIIQLDPVKNHTFYFWHVYVRELKLGMFYAHRLDGPQDVHQTGNRFDKNKVVTDPYTRGIDMSLWNRMNATRPGDDNLTTSIRAAIIDTADYHWEGDEPLHRPINEAIIYELHAGGFTRSPSSGSVHPGTFTGVIDKISYLQALGVTAVELLPVFAFDEQGIDGTNPLNNEPLKDYWGYNPICHFAPHAGYCVTPGEGSHIREFRDMVKALHKAGIEVILDVVFNHTGEGNQQGPTISFKGIDNSVYYFLAADDKQYYSDYTGCGNTFNCNHPITGKLISDCLEFWVKEMHVDGFRFDEATILARGMDGAVMNYPPVVWNISLNEALADTKVIAEAWDAGGLDKVGSFPGERWSEWNGQYRDCLRRFVRGDRGLVGEVATRITGSADLYQSTDRRPSCSINFITCHDGFTMNDLVSYDAKHNEANGPYTSSGTDDNLSWNCGVEGPTSDNQIKALRERQVKNFVAILLLSRGVPMILGGDEIGRTQQGNNNAFCQDNEISWFDWGLTKQNQSLFRFFQSMITFRKQHPNLTLNQFYTGEPDEQGQKDIEWHGCQLDCPSWNDPNSAVLAFSIWGRSQDDDIHVMLNMELQDLDFDIPPLTRRRWRKVIDTAQPSPTDILDYAQGKVLFDNSCRVTAHSVVVLVSYNK